MFYPRVARLAFECSLSRGQASDWDSVGAAADVVEARADTELDAVWLATVLATDAALQFRTRGATFLNGHFDQLANTRFVDLLERCLLYTSPSPRDQRGSRMPSSA